jgi:heme-degrading monooxygenase HmoA
VPVAHLVVTLHVWGVPRRGVPLALARMALHRRPLHRQPGLRFAKLLGTGDGTTFTVRDGDPRHWGALAVWADDAAAAAYERSPVVRAWDAVAQERLRVVLEPLASRGQWAGREPFGNPAPRQVSGPVAAITRARIRPALARTFWRSVPPVSADLRRTDGLRLAFGIGEAPIGLQGTFSLWDSPDALTSFAHRGAAHREAVRRTAELGWYAEELFARFTVVELDGTYRGRTP